MRETNHLRKLANESGKKMRGPRGNEGTAADMQKCSICGHSLWWHKTAEPGEIDHEFTAAEHVREGEQVKPIPIASAKLIALDYGYDQVVIIARKVGDGGGEHCTTYGVDKANCDVAARIGDFLKFKVMGWAAEHEPAPQPDNFAKEAMDEANKEIIRLNAKVAEDVRKATQPDLRQRIAEMFPCICTPPFKDGGHWHDCPIEFREEVEELVAAETAALQAEIERIKRVWEAVARMS